MQDSINDADAEQQTVIPREFSPLPEFNVSFNLPEDTSSEALINEATAGNFDALSQNAEVPDERMSVAPAEGTRTEESSQIDGSANSITTEVPSVKKKTSAKGAKKQPVFAEEQFFLTFKRGKQNLHQDAFSVTDIKLSGYSQAFKQTDLDSSLFKRFVNYGNHLLMYYKFESQEDFLTYLRNRFVSCIEKTNNPPIQVKPNRRAKLPTAHKTPSVISSSSEDEDDDDQPAADQPAAAATVDQPAAVEPTDQPVDDQPADEESAEEQVSDSAVKDVEMSSESSDDRQPRGKNMKVLEQLKGEEEVEDVFTYLFKSGYGLKTMWSPLFKTEPKNIEQVISKHKKATRVKLLSMEYLMKKELLKLLRYREKIKDIFALTNEEMTKFVEKETSNKKMIKKVISSFKEFKVMAVEYNDQVKKNIKVILDFLDSRIKEIIPFDQEAAVQELKTLNNTAIHKIKLNIQSSLEAASRVYKEIYSAGLKVKFLILVITNLTKMYEFYRDIDASNSIINSQVTLEWTKDLINKVLKDGKEIKDAPTPVDNLAQWKQTFTPPIEFNSFNSCVLKLISSPKTKITESHPLNLSLQRIVCFDIPLNPDPTPINFYTDECHNSIYAFTATLSRFDFLYHNGNVRFATTPTIYEYGPFAFSNPVFSFSICISNPNIQTSFSHFLKQAVKKSSSFLVFYELCTKLQSFNLAYKEDEKFDFKPAPIQNTHVLESLVGRKFLSNCYSAHIAEVEMNSILTQHIEDLFELAIKRKEKRKVKVVNPLDDKDVVEVDIEDAKHSFLEIDCSVGVIQSFINQAFHVAKTNICIKEHLMKSIAVLIKDLNNVAKKLAEDPESFERQDPRLRMLMDEPKLNALRLQNQKIEIKKTLTAFIKTVPIPKYNVPDNFEELARLARVSIINSQDETAKENRKIENSRFNTLLGSYVDEILNNDCRRFFSLSGKQIKATDHFDYKSLLDDRCYELFDYITNAKFFDTADTWMPDYDTFVMKGKSPILGEIIEQMKIELRTEIQNRRKRDTSYRFPSRFYCLYLIMNYSDMLFKNDTKHGDLRLMKAKYERKLSFLELETLVGQVYISPAVFFALAYEIDKISLGEVMTKSGLELCTNVLTHVISKVLTMVVTVMYDGGKYVVSYEKIIDTFRLMFSKLITNFNEDDLSLDDVLGESRKRTRSGKAVAMTKFSAQDGLFAAQRIAERCLEEDRVPIDIPKSGIKSPNLRDRGFCTFFDRISNIYLTTHWNKYYSNTINFDMSTLAIYLFKCGYMRLSDSSKAYENEDAFVLYSKICVFIKKPIEHETKDLPLYDLTEEPRRTKFGVYKEIFEIIFGEYAEFSMRNVRVVNEYNKMYCEFENDPVAVHYKIEKNDTVFKEYLYFIDPKSILYNQGIVNSSMPNVVISYSNLTPKKVDEHVQQLLFINSPDDIKIKSLSVKYNSTLALGINTIIYLTIKNILRLIVTYPIEDGGHIPYGWLESHLCHMFNIEKIYGVGSDELNYPEFSLDEDDTDDESIELYRHIEKERVNSKGRKEKYTLVKRPDGKLARPIRVQEITAADVGLDDDDSSNDEKLKRLIDEEAKFKFKELDIKFIGSEKQLEETLKRAIAAKEFFEDENNKDKEKNCEAVRLAMLLDNISKNEARKQILEKLDTSEKMTKANFVSHKRKKRDTLQHLKTVKAVKPPTKSVKSNKTDDPPVKVPRTWTSKRLVVNLTRM